MWIIAIDSFMSETQEGVAEVIAEIAWSFLERALATLLSLPFLYSIV
jgi:hypothetical protein